MWVFKCRNNQLCVGDDSVGDCIDSDGTCTYLYWYWYLKSDQKKKSNLRRHPRMLRPSNHSHLTYSTFDCSLGLFNLNKLYSTISQCSTKHSFYHSEVQSFQTLKFRVFRNCESISPVLEKRCENGEATLGLTIIVGILLSDWPFSYWKIAIFSLFYDAGVQARWNY